MWLNVVGVEPKGSKCNLKNVESTYFRGESILVNPFMYFLADLRPCWGNLGFGDAFPPPSGASFPEPRRQTALYCPWGTPRHEARLRNCRAASAASSAPTSATSAATSATSAAISAASAPAPPRRGLTNEPHSRVAPFDAPLGGMEATFVITWQIQCTTPHRTTCLPLYVGLPIAGPAPSRPALRSKRRYFQPFRLAHKIVYIYEIGLRAWRRHLCRESVLQAKKWGRRRPNTSMFVLICPAVFEIQGFEISRKLPPPLILRKHCHDCAVQRRLDSRSNKKNNVI